MHYHVRLAAGPLLFFIAALAAAETPPANSAALLDMVKRARTASEAPAMIAAVAGTDADPLVAFDGVRNLGKDDLVTREDRWHFGSVSKSMTATLVARMIEQGKLRWDMPLTEVLGDIDMLPEYKTVTLEQVMHHRAGLQQMLRPEPELNKTIAEIKDGPVARRAALVRWLMKQPPVATPGSEMKYSNGGYALLGHIAERVGGAEYPVLMKREVFEPLGMKTAAFGWPVDSGENQPRGHGRGPNGLQAAPASYRLPDQLDPAGNIHGTLADLTRFLQAHLQGMQGKDGYLKAATIERLHRAPPADGRRAYAAGWGIDRIADVGTKHGHNGSAGTFYAEMAIVPERNLAVAVAANAGPKRDGPPAEAKLIEEIIRDGRFGTAKAPQASSRP